MKRHVFTSLFAALFIGASAAEAGLVAYWPLNDGPADTEVTGADDVIDAGLTFTDATVEGGGGTWVDDPVRGIVFSTGEDDRLVGGTMGINLLAGGFTWSLWVKVASSNIDDPGADVIIGSRNGTWHKLQPTGLQRWADIGGFNVADDEWHHMALIGTEEPRVSLYIDGELIGSDETFFQDNLAVDDKFEFGGSSRFSEDITGLMSDIAVWDEAISVTQIEALAAGAPVLGGDEFEITAVEYSAEDGMLTLTWDSDEDDEFAVKWSRDMQNWDADLDDGVSADPGDSTTATFDLNQAGISGFGRIYFRVEKS